MVATPIEAGGVVAAPVLAGATGKVGPAKGVLTGEAVGWGEGTGAGDVVGGVAAGVGLVTTGVCAETDIAAAHRKTGTRIPESWPSRRRFKLFTRSYPL